ncbi:MAG: hypothetical protein GVY36_11030 [Verrucomicrobia bacterium]|jgi:hypothetical protein|nr:hypothetical protein [Verrucomicrobiota bacterium]
MCTLSWQVHPQGYDLCFTRDEQRSRALAESPAVHQVDEGLHYLAPTDPQGGGTWIFINAHGLTGALLNAYELAEHCATEAPQSRGQLLRSLATAETVAAFDQSLSEVVNPNYPPCYLFALAADGSVGFWLWNGHSLEPQTIPANQFFTTSSVQPEAVRTHRAERFRRELGLPPYTSEALEQFHHDANSHLSAFDVRMSRRDARSVSLTKTYCTRDARQMHYAPRDGDGPFAPFARVTLEEK